MSNSESNLPIAIQGVMLVVQRINGNAQPSVTCIAANDGATLKQIMANPGVTEAEAYAVTGVKLVGTKSIAIAADGVFERAR